MCTRLFALVVGCCLVMVQFARAADEAPKLSVAQGIIDSVDKDMLVVQPQAANGKFEKSVSLKLTGTSTFEMLSTRTTAGKTVLVQKAITAKDLAAKQKVTLIYATEDKDMVLLVAVVEAP